MIGVAYAEEDDCDLVGSWRTFSASTWTTDEGYIGGTEEATFSDDGQGYIKSWVHWGDDCIFGQEVNGTYRHTGTLTNGTWAGYDIIYFNATSCEYVNCENECSSFCALPCNIDEVLEWHIEYDNNCNTFYEKEQQLTYIREGAYWWVWFLLGMTVLLLVCCCCCCCVACCACCGFVGYKVVTGGSTDNVSINQEYAAEAGPTIKSHYGATDLY
eukprot:CAMPEP_0114628842 /NCGR_PEP_ID=MMETSP0168-20121206/13039_1 /TAXON_ID=95228 ORGANISM="Vannella sp., Strain DIVA3 517/6/12" /NCGR_SAMPLE_ID=MMETSP0168 /ASSEMBLY_ACC=CAM_ASM_000044 /LENGTH=213 /DNA_ID=CAMNT_0001840257 /DNA_START=110 /DNA_END=751 /DNA_ORIENTATION=+